MRILSLIAMASTLLACGSHQKDSGAEDSKLGSLSVKTTIPSTFLPRISKVEILLKGSDAKETTYTLASLAESNADIMIPAGDYTVNVKLYRKDSEQDVLYAQTLKDNALCPELKATVKGSTKTDINATVCTVDNTVSLDNSSGSAAVNVNVSGFQSLLQCNLPQNSAQSVYKSLGVDASLKADNTAAAFRIVLGKLDANGNLVNYAAALQLDQNTTSSSTAVFNVTNSKSEKIGTFLLSVSPAFIYAYSLKMNDGNNLASNLEFEKKCEPGTIRPVSMMNFLKGL